MEKNNIESFLQWADNAQNMLLEDEFEDINNNQ